MSTANVCAPLMRLRVEFDESALDSLKLLEGYYLEDPRPSDGPSLTRGNRSVMRKSSRYRLGCQQIREMKDLGTDVVLLYSLLPRAEETKLRVLDDPYAGTVRPFPRWVGSG
ncbi:hypothetical protein PM082_019874 [Marasmius tenuissimus]|nr:hypothetical protein PM082_019874 [Marasmius tenuissimus]